jgi:hypothetical protein
MGDVDHGAVPPCDPAPNAELLTGKRLGVDARRLRRVVPSVSVRVSPSLTSATVLSEKSQAKAEAESGVKRRAGNKRRRCDMESPQKELWSGSLLVDSSLKTRYSAPACARIVRQLGLNEILRPCIRAA